MLAYSITINNMNFFKSGATYGLFFIFLPFPHLNDMVSKRTQNSSPSCVVALSQSIANERPSDKMQLLSHKLLYQTLQIDLLIIIFDTIDVSASK